MANSIPFQENDGGHKDSGIQDHSNCVVIGFAIVTGVPYIQADEIAVKTKRKRNKGHYPEKMVNYAKRKYKMKFLKLRFTSITLKKFLEKYKEGRYYVQTRKHAYAILDGVIHDHSHNDNLHRPGHHIKKAYKFIS